MSYSTPATTAEEVAKTYAQFLSSFKQDTEQQKQYAQAQLDFVLRQLNDASLMGNINSWQYVQLSMSAESSLWCLIYLSQGNLENDETFYQELHELDAQFESSRNFLRLMLTRVINGADYKKSIEEIHARTPQQVVISQPR